jgi:hypothetical protein
MGGSVHKSDYGEQLMPLSTLVPFALVAVIGIVVVYTAYRAELERSAINNLKQQFLELKRLWLLLARAQSLTNSSELGRTANR